MKFTKVIKADENEITFSNSKENINEDQKRFEDLYEHITDFLVYEENRVTSPSGNIMPQDKEFINKLKDVQSDLYSFLVNLQYED